MANYYFDSSGLVKRYDPREIGSAWVASLTDPTAAHLVLASQLAADGRLCRAALAEGVMADNPLNHP